MTKSELVDQVADRSDLTKVQAARAIDAVLGTVEDALRRGSEVTLSGFGRFHVAERGARQGVNPRTGERIQIAASRVPRFSAGSGLKAPSAVAEPVPPRPFGDTLAARVHLCASRRSCSDSIPTRALSGRASASLVMVVFWEVAERWRGETLPRRTLPHLRSRLTAAR